MNIYTVSFFGHRELSDPFTVEDRLEQLLRQIIQTKEYVDFLVGRDGEFDQLVSSTIRRCKEQYGCGNDSHILVLPYERADYRDNRESFEEYYDEVEICYESTQAHPKAAIFIRNKEMIDRSDMVICCVEHKYGGAYRAMRYAETAGKEIINLYDHHPLS
ncbi:MAG: hypothetical protein IJ746_08110 [Ruminococcus sp.]|nr:hypothetical protein [Ruminococcus sp.]